MAISLNDHERRIKDFEGQVNTINSKITSLENRPPAKDWVVTSGIVEAYSFVDRYSIGYIDTKGITIDNKTYIVGWIDSPPVDNKFGNYNDEHVLFVNYNNVPTLIYDRGYQGLVKHNGRLGINGCHPRVTTRHRYHFLIYRG